MIHDSQNVGTTRQTAAVTGERIDEGGRSVQESVPRPKGDEAAIRAAAQWALEPRAAGRAGCVSCGHVHVTCPEQGVLEEQKGGQPVPRAGRRGDSEVTVQGCDVFVSFGLDGNVLNVVMVVAERVTLEGRGASL